MKQSLGLVLPVGPTHGDVCFNTASDTLYFCNVDGLWEAIGAKNIVPLSTVLICTANFTPWADAAGPISDFPGHVALQLSFGYDEAQFSVLSRSFFDILEMADDGTIYNMWAGLKFTATAEVMAFIRANCEESTITPASPKHNVYMRVYDIVSNEVPKLNKIYGINRFYSLLKGRKQYRNNKPSVDSFGTGWTHFATWFDELSNQLIGFEPGHVYAAGDESSIWMSMDDRCRYGLPDDGFGVNLTNAGGRKIWDWVSHTYIPVVIDGYLDSGQRAYCSLDLFDNKNSWNWSSNPYGWETMRTVDFAHSTVVFYGLERNGDPNHRAVFLKPVGIDAVAVNWFDTSKYDLFGHYARKGCTPVSRPITDLGQGSISNDLQWIEKPAWCVGAYDITSVAVGDLAVRFFLKDKITDAISPLTKARVQTTKRRHDAPIKWEVK